MRATAILLLVLAALAGGRPAQAMALTVGHGMCHVLVPAGTTIERVPAAAFTCDRPAARPGPGILLLRIDPQALGVDRRDLVVLLPSTRFTRLAVRFLHDDGTSQTQVIRQGDFASHWRTGGQIVFTDDGFSSIREILIGFEGLASPSMARVRLLTYVDATRSLAMAAAVTSGALTLLLIGAIYNLSLALAGRRQFLAWQAMWAALVVVWGLVWSQLVLIALPQLAGTAASRICTVLSTFAFTAATLSVVTALPVAMRRPWQRVATALAVATPATGIPLSYLSGARFETLYILLDLICLADLAVIASALAVAWRAGDGEARDLTLAWASPMIVFGLTSLIDFGTGFFGGGAPMAVLCASALQTVILSVMATRRLARLRIELDAARAAESALAELANRDPLTGLLNRRGFVERVAAVFAGGNPAPFGLLLIDVDKFKSINDRFGHEVGDAVLSRIGARLRLLERELCIAGRLGGEEFVVGVSGLTSFALEAFADRVRQELGALDHDGLSRQRRVTVSVGVAEGSTATPFQRLYGLADRALYDAKNAGRDRVVFHSDAGDRETRERLARDQHSFGW